MSDEQARGGAGGPGDEREGALGRAPGDVPEGPAGDRAVRDATTSPDAHESGGRNAGIGPGTGLEAPAPLGTSEGMAPVQGVHVPDVGPGGDDLDTADPAVPGRPRIARQPE